MRFSEKYPDYAAIEEHIRRARVERSLAIALILSNLVMGTVNAVKRLVKPSGESLPFERERQAIAADAFLKRSVPRY